MISKKELNVCFYSMVGSKKFLFFPTVSKFMINRVRQNKIVDMSVLIFLLFFIAAPVFSVGATTTDSGTSSATSELQMLAPSAIPAEAQSGTLGGVPQSAIATSTAPVQVIPRAVVPPSSPGTAPRGKRQTRRFPHVRL